MVKKMIIIGLILVIVLASGILILRDRLLSVVKLDSKNIIHGDVLIKDVFTDKSRYTGGETARITLCLENPECEDIKGDIHLVLKYLDRVVKEKKFKNVNLKAGEKNNRAFELEMPPDDFKGYLLEVWFTWQNKILDFNSTAIDVSSDWSKFPRYGYIAGYPKQDTQKTSEIIENLCKYHINGLQFYDWQYKHHKPISRSTGSVDKIWKEIANRTVCAKTVRDYITETHKRNMAAMNYNLVYGAWVGYEEDSVKRQWGLFKDANHKNQDFHPLPGTWASYKLLLFNPLNPQWQDYIINREDEVFKAFDFDGWHMDQLGVRNGALYDYEGNIVELTSGFTSLIEKANNALKDKYLVFNAVGQYGQMQVAGEPGLDFLYVEVWNPNSYRNLKIAIDEGSRLTDNKKATVLAAYMNYGKNSGEFNEHSVRLADAVIFASGGAHMELGDTGMLSSEYFPNTKLVMGESLKTSMRRYYDFMTAYQNFLRDGCEDLPGNVEIEGINVNKGVFPGIVWYMAKRKDNHEILHLINFLSNNTNDWRDDTGTRNPPVFKENLNLKYYTDSDIAKALFVTPDFGKSHVEVLEIKSGSNDKGKFVEIQVPRLEYWDMIVFEKK